MKIKQVLSLGLTALIFAVIIIGLIIIKNATTLKVSSNWVAHTYQVQSMLSGNVEEIGYNIMKLSERTNQIGNISLIVNNFAIQTKLFNVIPYYIHSQTTT